MRDLLLKTGVAACALVFTAAFGAANAVPSVPGVGLVVPVVDEQPTEGSDSQNFWTNQGLTDDSDDPSKASVEAPSGGDPEIRGLQEEFPQTEFPSKRN